MRVNRLVGIAVAGLLAGCGTTRQTDTQRAATEMLLVSQAVDQAVAQIDFAPLKDKTVFLDVQYLDPTTVDKGYLISSLRQHLLAHGALLRDDKKEAVYVVEPRAGGIGTDRHNMLVGTPQLSLPAVLPGMPTQLPEIALYKKTDQKGVAKIAVFAYNRVNGRALWQSGRVEEVATLKDRWLFGAGPFSDGSIRQRTELAGSPLPKLPHIPYVGGDSHDPDPPAQPTPAVPPTEPHQWVNADAPPPPQPVPFGLMGLVGPAAVADRPVIR
jgi:hypothetical protein